MKLPTKGMHVVVKETVHETLPTTLYKGIVTKVGTHTFEIGGFTKKTKPLIIMQKNGKNISPEVQFTTKTVQFDVNEFKYSWHPYNSKKTIKKLNRSTTRKLYEDNHWWNIIF
jgi:hypothetical protein